MLFIALIAIIVLPIVLLLKRKMNVSLGIFYVFLVLGMLGEMAGNSTTSIGAIIGGTCGFALAVGVEYVVRREYRLAAVAALVLLLFAYAIYTSAEAGAFA